MLAAALCRQTDANPTASWADMSSVEKQKLLEVVKKLDWTPLGPAAIIAARMFSMSSVEKLLKEVEVLLDWTPVGPAAITAALIFSICRGRPLPPPPPPPSSPPPPPCAPPPPPPPPSSAAPVTGFSTDDRVSIVAGPVAGPIINGVRALSKKLRG